MSTTKKTTTPGSTLADEPAPGRDWPQLPTETEIYILPDGRVVFADLPEELTELAASLGRVQSCEISEGESSSPDPASQ